MPTKPLKQKLAVRVKDGTTAIDREVIVNGLRTFIGRERERESVCVCVSVCERERERERKRKRKRKKEKEKE